MARPNQRIFGASAMGLALLCMGTLTSCERIEAVIEDVRPAPATPHEAYLVSLEEAGLGGTALAARWHEAAVGALSSPVELEPPFEEVAFYPAEEPTAAAYLISIDQGQSIQVSYSTEPFGASGVFVDVFRLSADGSTDHVAYTHEGDRALEFEPSSEGDFLIRVQAELLQDVRVTLRIVKAAVLAFPVLDHDTGDIQSFFGASRDAGRRSHHGVDIFAPRGTPVLAVSEGVVSRVGDQRLGGKVVWVRDNARGTSQYYAHLDEQLVERGRRVQAGDTLGLVGNTGNARTTPPHLHFGLYRRGEGPLDPFGFLDEPPDTPPPLRADPSLIGEWVRTRADARVAFDGQRTTDGDEELARYSVLRLLGAAGRDLRVRLPDGRVGLVRTGVELLDTPIDETVVAAGEAILSSPERGAPRRTTAESRSTVAVVGRFSDFLLVSPANGPRAWVEVPR
ncbi:MAG: M23 family metallopeptidase [Gemmatimonadota bacterium]|nr:M23 family metallopeptidase [Gemmatimonadota bacterium]